MTRITKITEPDEIERRSFAIIDSEVLEPRPFEGAHWEVVRRMIHTSADFELLSLAVFHNDAVQAGIAAIRRGCTIVTDTEMARAGIGLRRIDRWGCRVKCFM
ncbi:MAG TPA: precorrin-8X methylmutase, partial [Deltaproteobacteria bacterium]|nr:precorrin-8X methylmutase [Deltaproteobacteria bacterium]